MSYLNKQKALSFDFIDHVLKLKKKKLLMLIHQKLFSRIPQFLVLIFDIFTIRAVLEDPKVATFLVTGA